MAGKLNRNLVHTKDAKDTKVSFGLSGDVELAWWGPKRERAGSMEKWVDFAGEGWAGRGLR